MTIDTSTPGAPGAPVASLAPNAGSFTLSWPAATDAGGAGIGSYTIERSADGGATFVVASSGVAGTTRPQSGRVF